MTEMREPGKFGLSGSALKWIAIVLMLIDHMGASIIEVYLMNVHGNAPYQGYGSLPYEQIMTWYWVDYAMRCVGRPAFPIFCFLLVEGCLHTGNIRKYALRLGLFCVLSEIPFDLALFGELFCLDHQNVFFTLLLSLLGIRGMDWFAREKKPVLGVLCILAAAGLAEYLHTDYGAFGVGLATILYLFRNQKLLRTLAGFGALLAYGGIEILGVLAFLPIHFYDGTRGKQPRYFFYAFYPVHLLILAAFGYWVLPRIL